MHGEVDLRGGAPAERVVAECLKLGFDGPIWPVHPKRASLAGVPCVASLDALPGVPDAVFLGVNRHLTIEAMHTLSAIGTGGVVCYGSGFGETGDDALQRSLLEAAGDVPFFGPNCYGFVNTLSRAALWPDETGLEQVERGVALITQSGNIACNFTMMMRGLPVAALEHP